MGIDSPGISVIIVVPDMVKDVFPGKRHLLVSHEIVKEFEFLKAQIHRFAIYRYRMGRLVDNDPVVFRNILVSR